MKIEKCRTCLWYDEDIDHCLASCLEREEVEACEDIYQEYIPIQGEDESGDPSWERKE